MDSQKGLFRQTHIKLLTNKDATKVEIEKALGYDLMNAGKDDTVIIFFSGHGADDPKKPGEYFFLGCDADPKYLEATSVKMSGLEFMKGIDAPRILVVADACHAGGFSETRTKAVHRAMGQFVEKFAESSGKVVIASSKPGEYSQIKPGMQNSVFTHYLLKGLNGEADADRNGIVTFNEIYEYVYERTKVETEGAQHPQSNGSVVGSFPVSVIRKSETKIALEAFFIAQDPRCRNAACMDPQPGTLCKDAMCGDVDIVDGGTMYCGQNYQIGVRPSDTCHIYVYQVDHEGKLFRLFPGDDYLAPDNPLVNPLKGGQTHWIPGKWTWMRQDDQEGSEKIYVMASRSKNLDLENLYQQLESARKSVGSDSAGAGIQREIQGRIDRLMAPQKGVQIRKVESPKSPGPGGAGQALVARMVESMEMDSVVEIKFQLKKR